MSITLTSEGYGINGKTVEIHLRKKTLKKLRQSLPSGSIELLVLKLIEKGYTFSKQYIYRVMDPQDGAYNTIIVSSAIELLDELNMIRQQKEKRIEELSR